MIVVGNKNHEAEPQSRPPIAACDGSIHSIRDTWTASRVERLSFRATTTPYSIKVAAIANHTQGAIGTPPCQFDIAETSAMRNAPRIPIAEFFGMVSFTVRSKAAVI